jgi:flagellar basal-body rod protein FlgF
VPSFQARFAEAIQRGLASPGDQSINNIGGGVKMYGVATNFSEGQFSSTGKDLDFAIAGNGFFHVQQDDGKVYLSRAGDFSIDATGRLVTSEGQFPVLDQQDSEMTINPDLPWYVTPDGFLVQDGGAKAIGLSQPKSLDELQKVGNNMFRPTGKIEPVPLEERDIRQGYLELSGSNPINQMMAMIEATRGFEANSRMIQAQDTAIGTLVGRVLRS